MEISDKEATLENLSNEVTEPVKVRENDAQMADQLAYVAHNLFEYDWSLEQRGQLCTSLIFFKNIMNGINLQI
jgi:hypothetical protein